MAGMPINIPIPAEGAIASYTSTDLIQGVGIIKFYATNGYLESSKSYLLKTSAEYSQDVLTGGLGTTSNTCAFDVILNKNMTIQGYANFQIPLAYYAVSGASSSNITGKLFKVVGGVETQIGATATWVLSWGGNAYWYWDVFVGMILCPVTILKAGDTLRFTISNSAPGTNKYIQFFHSPSNESYAFPVGEVGNIVLTTQTILNIPTKLDL